MSDGDGNDILPEDDSVFEPSDAVACATNESIDSIQDDSFSSVYCSTPSVKGQPHSKPATRGQAESRSLGHTSPAAKRKLSSRPQTLNPASPRPASRRQAESPSVSSPRPTTRSQARGGTPDPASPRPATRSQARAESPTVSSPISTPRIQTRGGTPNPASPRPATRSQARAESPRVSSPRPTTRSQARGGTPDPASARPAIRSHASAQSPRVSSPRPTTRSQARGGTPDPASPRPTTRSQARAESPRVSSPRLTARSQGRGGTPEPDATRTSRVISGISALPQRLPASAPSVPSTLKCPLCPSVLANKTTLATHKKRHAIKRAFARAAKREEFLAEMPVLAVHSLEKIVKEPLIGDIANSVNKFAKVVLETMKNRDESHVELFAFLCEKLHNLLEDHNSIFASTLQYVVLVGVNNFLNSGEFRDKLRGYILGLPISEPPDSVGTLNVFLTNFVMQLSYAAIIFYLKKIHGFSATQEVRKKRSDDTVDSTTFLEMSYYIGGSVVAGYLYKGTKLKASPWKAFVAILRNKFCRDHSISNACADVVRDFTESRDRGGLTHISQEALDFFVVLFDLLMSLEGVDGSLPDNVVDEHVLTNDVILCLWDTLVGTALDEDSSMDFLDRMARTCRNVVMKGIIKRKLNEHLKKAISSVSLRSRLAN